MRKFIKYIKCLFGIHIYIPVHDERFIRYGKNGKRKYIQGQFTCNCCGDKTHWMNYKDTKQFLSEHCSWGNRL